MTVKRIEFFGISNTGKSHIKFLIKKKLKRKNVYSYKEILTEFLYKEEKNFFQRVILKYYLKYKKKHLHSSKYIFFNKKKLTEKKRSYSYLVIIKRLVYNIYERNINKIFLKSGNQKFTKIVLNLINNSNFNDSNKNIFKRWLYEEITALYLSEKYLSKNEIVIDSEGFIQRLFIYTYKKKKKRNIIITYLKFCPFPHKLLITSPKRFKIKLFENNEFNLDLKEQYQTYNETLKIIKKKNFTEKINTNNLKKFVKLL